MTRRTRIGSEDTKADVSGAAPDSLRHYSRTVTVVLFTCAGQRVDIVRAFRAAGATALAADADPLAPALYHADRQAIVPRIAIPATSHRSSRSSASTTCGSSSR